jgi:hypothetical protein
LEGFFTVEPLPDGQYDVIVVDADTVDDTTAPPAVRLELALTGGPHKGDVLVLRATGLAREPLELLGLPGTLMVRDGVPNLRMD